MAEEKPFEQIKYKLKDCFHVKSYQINPLNNGLLHLHKNIWHTSIFGRAQKFNNGYLKSGGGGTSIQRTGMLVGKFDLNP